MVRKTNSAGSLARSGRLAKYSAAALAAATCGSLAADASADFVTVDTSGLNLCSSGSNELFVDILGFATGATSFNIQYTNNTASQYNPFSNSEIMVRAIANSASATGFAQVRARQSGPGLGAAVFTTNLASPYSAFYYSFVRDVGSVGVVPSSGSGTYLLGGTDGSANAFLAWGTYAPGKGDWADTGSSGVVYFRFVNSQTGKEHDAWLEVTNGYDADGDMKAAITSITVDTGVVPEPSSMGLLCMGAAGVAAMRRRRKEQSGQ